MGDLMTYALQAGHLGFEDLAANGLVDAAQPSQVEDDLADEIQRHLSRSLWESHPTRLNFGRHAWDFNLWIFTILG